MKLLERQVAWVWMEWVRLVPCVVKDVLLGYMEQILQMGRSHG
jgi:hypothetical protein